MPKKAEKKTYVRFWFAGVFVSEDVVRQVKQRDPKQLDIPKGAYAFQFFDRKEQTFKTDWGEDSTVRAKEENVSGMHYLDGIAMPAQEALKQPMSDTSRSILKSNIEFNKIKMIVKTCAGQMMPFEEDDKIFARPV